MFRVRSPPQLPLLSTAPPFPLPSLGGMRVTFSSGAAPLAEAPLERQKSHDLAKGWKKSRVLRSIMFNTTDPRFWLRRAAVVIIETCLLIYSLVTSFDNIVPRDMIIIALILMLAEPIRVHGRYKMAIASHAKLRNDFDASDVDKDGVLDSHEAASFLREFPEFSLRYNKFERYTIEDVRLLLQHRVKDLRGPAYEFLISWLCFFSGLMIKVDTQNVADEVFSIMLGVVGVFDLVHIIHRFFLHYLHQYSTRFCCLRICNRALYYSLILTLATLLICGFALATNFEVSGVALAGSDSLPATDTASFIVGWILTVAIMLFGVIIWIHFRFFYALGCLTWRDNSESDVDRKSRVILGTHNPLYSI